MRLLLLQIDMLMLAGEHIHFCEPEPIALTKRIQSARQSLVNQTDQDFGYDLAKWHEYLVANHNDEYCWSDKHEEILVRIRLAKASPVWLEAVATLEKHHNDLS